jgi:hypothetical protein
MHSPVEADRPALEVVNLSVGSCPQRGTIAEGKLGRLRGVLARTEARVASHLPNVSEVSSRLAFVQSWRSKPWTQPRAWYFS